MRLETRVIRILPGPRPLTISTTRVEGLPPTECLNPAGSTIWTTACQLFGRPFPVVRRFGKQQLGTTRSLLFQIQPALQTKSHPRPDDIDVTWTRAAVVLAHTINFQGEMFVESVAGADAEAVAHPLMQAPVVEHFV